MDTNSTFRPSVHQFHDHNPEAVAIGGLFLFLALVRVWNVLVGAGFQAVGRIAPGLQTMPIVLGSFVTGVLGFGLPAIGYLYLRGWTIPIGRPRMADPRVLLGAVISPIAIVAIVGIVGNGIFGRSISSLTQQYYSPDVSPIFLVRMTVLPALFGSVGICLVVYGVVQTRLRELTPESSAIVLTTIVAGVFYYLPMETLSTATVDSALVVLFLVSVLTSVIIGMAVGLLYRGVVTDDFERLLGIEQAAIIILGTLGVVAMLETMLRDPGFVFDMIWVLILGIGAYGYSTARSIWIPIATIFLFRLSVRVAVYAEAIVGIAQV